MLDAKTAVPANKNHLGSKNSEPKPAIELLEFRKPQELFGAPLSHQIQNDIKSEPNENFRLSAYKKLIQERLKAYNAEFDARYERGKTADCKTPSNLKYNIFYDLQAALIKKCKEQPIFRLSSKKILESLIGTKKVEILYKSSFPPGKAQKTLEQMYEVE